MPHVHCAVEPYDWVPHKCNDTNDILKAWHDEWFAFHIEQARNPNVDLPLRVSKALEALLLPVSEGGVHCPFEISPTAFGRSASPDTPRPVQIIAGFRHPVLEVPQINAMLAGAVGAPRQVIPPLPPQMEIGNEPRLTIAEQVLGMINARDAVRPQVNPIDCMLPSPAIAAVRDSHVQIDPKNLALRALRVASLSKPELDTPGTKPVPAHDPHLAPAGKLRPRTDELFPLPPGAKPFESSFDAPNEGIRRVRSQSLDDAKQEGSHGIMKLPQGVQYDSLQGHRAIRNQEMLRNHQNPPGMQPNVPATLHPSGSATLPGIPHTPMRTPQQTYPRVRRSARTDIGIRVAPVILRGKVSASPNSAKDGRESHNQPFLLAQPNHLVQLPTLPPGGQKATGEVSRRLASLSLARGAPEPYSMPRVSAEEPPVPSTEKPAQDHSTDIPEVVPLHRYPIPQPTDTPFASRQMSANTTGTRSSLAPHSTSPQRSTAPDAVNPELGFDERAARRRYSMQPTMHDAMHARVSATSRDGLINAGESRPIGIAARAPPMRVRADGSRSPKRSRERASLPTLGDEGGVDFPMHDRNLSVPDHNLNQFEFREERLVLCLRFSVFCSRGDMLTFSMTWQLVFRKRRAVHKFCPLPPPPKPNCIHVGAHTVPVGRVDSGK